MSKATIHSVESLAQLEALSQPQLIEAISGGLPAHLARELAKALDITRRISQACCG